MRPGLRMMAIGLIMAAAIAVPALALKFVGMTWAAGATIVILIFFFWLSRRDKDR